MAYRTEIEKLEQRHAENPKQWFAALADAYRKQGDVDLAIEYVRSGLDQRPDYASAHIVLGRCYLDKSMDDDAAQAFEQVLQLDSENIIALKSLEEIAERRGDVGGARHWLNRLLEVDPMNEDAHESLARLGDSKAPAAPPPVADEPQPKPAEEPAVEVPFESEFVELTAAEDSIQPMMVDATSPMDADEFELAEAPSAAIEPLGIETFDPGADSLLTGLSPEADSPFADGTPTASIEPIELETADADASSLLAGMPGEAGFASAEEESAPAYIEPFELDRADEEIGTVGVIESFEIETPASDASSLLVDLPTDAETAAEEEALPLVADFAYEEAELPAEAEPTPEEEVEVPLEAEYVFEEVELPEEAETVAEEEVEVPLEAEYVVEEVELSAEAETAAEEEFEVPLEAEYVFEEVELPAEAETAAEEEFEVPLEAEYVVEEEDLSQRVSVPPTKEVEAIDLEALRAADEMIARATVDSTVVDEAEVEPSGTTEIDAVEIERLRAQDALAARSAQKVEIVEEIEEEVEADQPSIDEELAEDFSAVGDIVVGTFDEDSGWGMAEAEEQVAVVDRQEEPPEAAEEPDRTDYDRDALPLIMPEEVGVGEASAHAEPEPVVTETMAEVYAKQGLFEQAREIYEVLVMQHPDDKRLKARLEELNDRVEGAIQETRKSRFSVTATGGESAVVYLQRLFAHERNVSAEVPAAAAATAAPEVFSEPEVDLAPTPLEEAFADEPAEVRGEPTVAAPDEVSLASVFDGGSPTPSSTGESGFGLDQIPTEPGTDDGVSFDEFYGAEPRPTLPEANGLVDDGDSSNEDDDFKNWLNGLKT